MKVIIVGLGKVGRTLTEELCGEGHNIVAIEADADVLQECVDRFDIQGICGNGCIAENLKEAGVEKCDMLIAVTPQDENNLLCCMVARVLGADNLVARVRDPEYFEQFEFMRGKLGIGMLVNPEEASAQEILRILRFPAASKVSTFSRGKVDIIEFKLPERSKLENMSLVDVRRKLSVDVLVVALERDGELIIPDGYTVLQAGDVLSVCAKHSEMRVFFKTFGLLKQKAQSVMILGGGREAFYLARELEESGFFVKVICNSYERCLDFKKGLAKAQVIFGDYTDASVLEDEGIESASAVVSMSRYDENNIVTSLYAKEKGVKKTITVLHGNSYRGILESIQLDTVISPFRIAASEVARYLRAVDMREDCRVQAMYKIADERIEALLFNLNGNEQFAGKTIIELNLPKGTLIAAVVRGKNAYIPDGNFRLEENDQVVVISMGRQILGLEDVLQS